MKSLLPLLFLTLPLQAQDTTYYQPNYPDSVRILHQENTQLKRDNQHLHDQNERILEKTSHFWGIVLLVTLVLIVTKMK